MLYASIDSIALMKEWTQEEEASRLAERFIGVNQAEFARDYGVPGGASMVSQHIKTRRPINLQAALAYARGFRVSLAEISPRLAHQAGEVALHEQESAGNVVQFRKTSPAQSRGSDSFDVPVLSAAASMGAGEDVQHDEVVVGRITLSPQWIDRTLRARPEALRFIHGYGDSMEPTFKDGDVLLVDTDRIDVQNIDGIYVLEADERLYIKRVGRKYSTGELEISSDNPTIKTVDVLAGNHPVRVLGKVVWLWNGRKL